MCGIFGFWLNRKLNPDDIKKGDKLTELLAHRGPDNQQNWYDLEKGIYFGFRRLSIIDLSENSNQPLIRGETSLVFNGEIYNFKDIKKNLIIKNYKFKSSGDAEVLINVWKDQKKDCLKQIDGMYAFAIFNEDKLCLVTDHFGEKPLFYLTNKEGVYFSSEIKPLLSIIKNNLKISKNFLNNFMQYGYDIDFETGFDGIKLIPPATIIEFGNPNDFKVSKYWNIDYSKENDLKNSFDSNDYKELKSILARSIERRLISDVPLGLFLSSGIDSSLIAAIVKKDLNYNLDTFTVSFEENDETYMSTKIANFLGLENKIIKVKNENFYSCQNLITIFNYPNDNLTALSIFLMSKAINDKIKVALTGLGGDEAFLGYNKYNQINSSYRKYNIPFYLKYILNLTSKLFMQRSIKISNFIKYVNYNFEKKYLFINNKITPEISNDIMIRNKYFYEESDILKQIINFERNITLPISYILANDLGSMRASIETRSPFLSKELFEFTNKFNSKCFFTNGNKTPLRNLLKNYLPSHLIEFSKKGFNVPTNKFNLSDNELIKKLNRTSNFNIKRNLSSYSSKDKNRISLRYKIIEEFKKQYQL